MSKNINNIRSVLLLFVDNEISHSENMMNNLFKIKKPNDFIIEYSESYSSNQIDKRITRNQINNTVYISNQNRINLLIDSLKYSNIRDQKDKGIIYLKKLCKLFKIKHCKRGKTEKSIIKYKILPK